MNSTTVRRLECKVPPDIRDLLDKAAALENLGTSNFVIQCALEKAQEIVARNQILQLTENQWDYLMDSLATPPKPSRELVELIKGDTNFEGLEKL